MNARDGDGLRDHLEVLQKLPSYNLTSTYREEIVRSLIRERKFGEAARELHRLTFFNYSNPAPHFQEARMLWLNNDARAQAANERLQKLISDNAITANLYRSRIESSHPIELTIMRTALDNSTAGLSWRTAIYVHPTVRIILPSDIALKSIEGEIGMATGSWFENTDGVTFSIQNHRTESLYDIRIDPHKNTSEQKWIPFHWNGKPQNIILVSGPGGSPSYDWAFLSINQTQ